MNKSFAPQRGVALIIVLLIVALVSVLATEMGSRLQLNVKRASNIKDNNQAYWYAMGAEQFARNVIRRLLDNSSGVVDLEQPWTEPVTYPLEGGGIEAQLKDLQACFNLNALTEPSGSRSAGNTSNHNEIMDAFHRLLSFHNVDSFSADTARDALADWLDDNSVMRDYGAEDAEYESRTHPYLAANGPMVSKTELRLVHGIDMAWLAEVLPFVCVIPGNNDMKLNVNTLTEEDAVVLAALTGMTVNDAADVISSRGSKGFNDVNSFLNDRRITTLNLTATQKDWFDVTTQHFILHTKTRYNNASFAMSSVLKADGNKLSVIRREFGGVN